MLASRYQIAVICLLFVVLVANNSPAKKLDNNATTGDKKLKEDMQRANALSREALTASMSPAVPRAVLPVTPTEITEEIIKTWHFANAADFPVSDFDSGATHQLDTGLTIYEGMRVDLYNSGKWEVSYTAAPNASMVTVELQIWLETETFRTLLFSIPPTIVRPDRAEAYHRFSTGASVMRVNLIERAGYSPAVKRHHEYFKYLASGSLEATDSFPTARLVRTGRALVGFGTESLR